MPDGNLATITYVGLAIPLMSPSAGRRIVSATSAWTPPERGDYFFSEATEANRALVPGEQVILVKDVSETDRYGRLLRYVCLEDSTFVNAELVRQGYAVIATFPPDVRHQA